MSADPNGPLAGAFYYDPRTGLRNGCRPMNGPMSYVSLRCVDCGHIITARDEPGVMAGMTDHQAYARDYDLHL